MHLSCLPAFFPAAYTTVGIAHIQEISSADHDSGQQKAVLAHMGVVWASGPRKVLVNVRPPTSHTDLLISVKCFRNSCFAIFFFFLVNMNMDAEAFNSCTVQLAEKKNVQYLTWMSSHHSARSACNFQFSSSKIQRKRKRFGVPF